MTDLLERIWLPFLYGCKLRWFPRKKEIREHFAEHFFFFQICLFTISLLSPFYLTQEVNHFLFSLQSVFLLDAQGSSPSFEDSSALLMVQSRVSGCCTSGEGADVRPLASFNTYHFGLENYLKFIVRNSINFTRHIYSVFKTLTALLTRVFCWKLEGLNGMLAFLAKCEKLFK